MPEAGRAGLRGVVWGEPERVDARVNVLLALALVLAVVGSSRAMLPLVVLAGCFSATLAMRIPARRVVSAALAPLGLVCVMGVVQALRVGSTPLFCVGGFVLHREGAMLGALMGARALAAVWVTLLLAACTPATSLVAALRALGAPAAWCEVFLLTMRYTCSLVDVAGRVAAAQAARLGYVGTRRSLTSFGVLCGEVVLRSVDQAARIHEAMQARGYGGVAPCRPLPPLGRLRWAVVALAWVGVALLWWSLGRGA